MPEFLNKFSASSWIILPALITHELTASAKKPFAPRWNRRCRFTLGKIAKFLRVRIHLLHARHDRWIAANSTSCREDRVPPSQHIETAIPDQLASYAPHPPTILINTRPFSSRRAFPDTASRISHRSRLFKPRIRARAHPRFSHKTPSPLQ